MKPILAAAAAAVLALAAPAHASGLSTVVFMEPTVIGPVTAAMGGGGYALGGALTLGALCLFDVPIPLICPDDGRRDRRPTLVAVPPAPEVSEVPLPGSLALLGAGLGGLAVLRRRRRR